MKKRLLIIGLALLVVFSMAACSTGEKVVTETDKAKKAVEQFLEAIKILDVEMMNEVLTEENQILEDDIVSSAQELEIYKRILKDLTYKYAEGEVEEGADKAEITYSLELLGREVMSNFKLIKEGDKWLIDKEGPLPLDF